MKAPKNPPWQSFEQQSLLLPQPPPDFWQHAPPLRASPPQQFAGFPLSFVPLGMQEQ